MGNGFNCCDTHRLNKLSELSLSNYYASLERKEQISESSRATSRANFETKEKILILTVVNTKEPEAPYTVSLTSSGTKNTDRPHDSKLYFGCVKYLHNEIINDVVIPIKEPENTKPHSGQHFFIYFKEHMNCYFIKDLGIGLGAFVKLQGPWMLFENTLINIGECFLIINKVGNSLSIKAYGTKTPSRNFLFEPTYNSLLLIGRNSDNHIPLQDSMISKIQCMLKFEAGVWKLVDGSKGRVSTNGTWVYIRDECQLRSGMILKAGQMVIRVEVSEVVK